ncbi:MAG: hypothetical protein K2N73_15635 [Lachnospiraceae bacterium]|nr:hypothetical protein [Lachnospiraceae bacterium]
MANTKRITEVLQKIGYEPEEGKTIVVSYAPENLSDTIKKMFFWNNFYALCFCKEQIVLIPYSSVWADVKKEVALELPYSAIVDVKVWETGLNYRIDIKLENEVIALSAQQAELSMLRSSGMYSLEDWTFVNNWHTHNLKKTLTALEALGSEKK